MWPVTFPVPFSLLFLLPPPPPPLLLGPSLPPPPPPLLLPSYSLFLLFSFPLLHLLCVFVLKIEGGGEGGGYEPGPLLSPLHPPPPPSSSLRSLVSSTYALTLLHLLRPAPPPPLSLSLSLSLFALLSLSLLPPSLHPLSLFLSCSVCVPLFLPTNRMQ